MRTPIGQVALIVLAALLAAACGGSAASASPSGAAHPPTLAGTNWGVVSVAGRASVPASTPFINFTADRAQGTGGCNSFGGDFTYDPATGTLRFGELGMTLMLCMGPQGDFETVFFAALQGPQQVTRTTDNLFFDGPKGRIVLAPAARDTGAG